MQHILENEFLKITTDSHGAELHSILGKKSNTEFLWDAQPQHWGYHAPALFPIIGRLKDDNYMYKGKQYNMGKHGFARASEFTEAEGYSPESVTYVLHGNQMENYPFDFDLQIKYTLEFNELLVSYIIENTGENDLLFSIGGHPAFKCPLISDEKFDDFYLEFNKEETAELMCITPEGYFGRETKPYLNAERKIPLNYELFANDALVFKNLKSESIALKSKNHSKYVELAFEGFPYLGIWTKKDAAFVCLEPWLGHADYEDANGILEDKEGIISLKAGRIFECGYTIRIFDIAR